MRTKRSIDVKFIRGEIEIEDYLAWSLDRRLQSSLEKGEDGIFYLVITSLLNVLYSTLEGSIVHMKGFLVHKMVENRQTRLKTLYGLLK